jgi:transposase
MSAKGLNVKRTWGSREKINALIKKERDSRVKERLQGVLWRLENTTYTEIANRLKRTIDTVREWIKNWNKLGYAGLIDKQKSGRPSILSNTEVKEIVDELNVKETQSRITCKTLVQRITEKFNKQMSEDAVRTMIRKHNISWKKPDKVDYRRNEEQRKLFIEKFSKKNI